MKVKRTIYSTGYFMAIGQIYTITKIENSTRKWLALDGYDSDSTCWCPEFFEPYSSITRHIVKTRLP